MLLIKIDGLNVTVATVNHDVMEYNTIMNNFLPIKWELCGQQDKDKQIQILEHENAKLKAKLNAAYSALNGDIS